MLKNTLVGLLLLVAQAGWSQMPSIKDSLSAEERISAYLLAAETSQESIAVFYREQTATTYASKADSLVVHQNSGMFIQCTAQKLRYVSADLDSLGQGDTPIPFRYESFIVNGKEKRRFYDILNALNVAPAKEVPVDPETGMRACVNIESPKFWTFNAKEIEPLGLVICDFISTQSRFSSVEKLVQLMLSEFMFEKELELGNGKLAGKWRRGDLVREIVFDDLQGGLPVITKNYLVDSSGKATSVHNSVLRCSWKEISPDSWVAEKLTVTFTGGGRSVESHFDFVWLDQKKMTDLFEDGDFKKAYSQDSGDWYRKVFSTFFPDWSKSEK